MVLNLNVDKLEQYQQGKQLAPPALEVSL